MEKEETKKAGGEGDTVKGEEKRSLYESCQSRCAGFVSSEEMKNMFKECCGDMSAADKKSWNWQDFCKCMLADDKVGKKQNDCC
jgi:hypothetical protein